MFAQQVLRPMAHTIRASVAVKMLAVLLLGLAVAGCAGKKYDVNASGGANATPGSAQDFAVNVGDRVFFETDSTDLTARARTTLDLQSQWLARYPTYNFVVEGHADERGTREYNIALGARRAAAVRAYLIARGVNSGRMSTISYGKERPVAVCNDISCWSQNRRSVTSLKGAGS